MLTRKDTAQISSYVFPALSPPAKRALRSTRADAGRDDPVKDRRPRSLIECCACSPSWTLASSDAGRPTSARYAWANDGVCESVKLLVSNPMSEAVEDDRAAVLFYDSSCGACTWIAARVRAAGRGTLRAASIDSAEGHDALACLNEADRLRSWHMLDERGVLYSAGEASMLLLERIPSAWLLVALARSAPTATDTLYRAIAGRRSVWGRFVPQRCVARARQGLADQPHEAARCQRTHSAPVYFARGSRGTPELFQRSICILAGRLDAPLVVDVLSAVKGGGAGAVADILQAYGTGRQMSSYRAAPRDDSHAHRLPVFIDVSYCGTPVVEGIVVDSCVGATAILVPHAGGTVDPQAFVASTYADTPVSEDIATFVIVPEADLGILERAALHQIPGKVSALTIGGGDASPGGARQNDHAEFVVDVAASLFLALHAQGQFAPQSYTPPSSERQGVIADSGANGVPKTRAAADVSTVSGLSLSQRDVEAGVAVQTLTRLRATLVGEGWCR